MKLPPTRYVGGGTPVQNQSAAPAISAAKGAAEIGNAIAGLGDKGMKIAEQAREAKEAKIMSGFILGMDKEAADFSNSLMTRSDTENWATEWRDKIEATRGQMNDLELSPVAKDAMGLRFDGWASDRSIRFEAQVAQRNVLEARAMIGNAMQYHTSRGEFTEAEAQLPLLAKTGVGEADLEKAGNEIKRQQAVFEMDQVVENNPQHAVEALKDPEFIKRTPGITEADRKRALNNAESQIQNFRQAEMDKLESKYFDGTLQDDEIKNATYLTDKDKRSLQTSISNSQAPSNENHAKAWGVLDKLRDARQSPEVSEADYRKLFNETRSEVLGYVPPKFQGDLKQELSYLSPAGRDPSTVLGQGFTTQDIQAVGRSVIFGARDVGDFGNLDDPKSKASAFTKAEKLRSRFNQWTRTEEGKNATIEAAEIYAAGLSMGSATSSAARKYSGSVPSAGQRLKILLPGGQSVEMPAMGGGNDASSDLLPPRDALEERLK